MALEATITAIDANMRPIRAVVSVPNRAILIACSRNVGYGDWEATHKLDKEGNQGALPSCFVLNADAIAALEAAAKEFEDA